MTRLFRTLFNLSAVLSLTMCVTATAVWSVQGTLYAGRNPQFVVASHNGLLDLGVNQSLMTIPLLAPILIGIPLPLWWLRAHLEKRDAARAEAQDHLCPTCGYDLRATPNRCPECGTVPEAGKMFTAPNEERVQG